MFADVMLVIRRGEDFALLRYMLGSNTEYEKKMSGLTSM